MGEADAADLLAEGGEIIGEQAIRGFDRSHPRRPDNCGLDNVRVSTGGFDRISDGF